MASHIQFQPNVNWRWVKISTFFLLAAAGCLIGVGPSWAIIAALAGLLFSFIAFVQSLRRNAGAPPVLPSVVLAIFNGLFIAAALIMGAFFLWPASEQSFSDLTKKVEIPGTTAEVWIPSNWSATPLMTGEIGVSLQPVEQNEFLTVQDVKVLFRKHSSDDKNNSAEPDVNTFTVKKFWLRFHQVTIIGQKGPDTLCSVSAASLPPHLIFAQNLCKAVFKKIEVPVTIKQ